MEVLPQPAWVPGGEGGEAIGRLQEYRATVYPDAASDLLLAAESHDDYKTGERAGRKRKG